MDCKLAMLFSRLDDKSTRNFSFSEPTEKKGSFCFSLSFIKCKENKISATNELEQVIAGRRGS